MKMAQSYILLAMLAACAWLAPSARADEPRAELYDFAMRTWTKADGLPDTSVSMILQTRDGYLWVGTAAGLARFDGVKFSAVPLPGPLAITALCEDTNGSVWIGTQNDGLYRWQRGRISHFGAAEGLLDPAITSLTVDGRDNVWIGTHQGVNRWDGQKLRSLTTRDGLPDNSVLSVHAAKSGTVWITTAGSTCRYIAGRLTPFHLQPTQDLLEVYEDQRGNLWAFCGTYITYFTNLAEGRRINYFPGEKSSVTRSWSLCEGRGGRLWIGAGGRGVFCFDGQTFEPVTLNEGRWPNDVRSICEDHEGNLWLGISAVGLVQLRPQTFSLLTDHPGLPPGAATCLVTDAQENIYVGMDSGGVYRGGGERFEDVRDAGRVLSGSLVSTLCTTPDGSLWAGTSGSGMCQYQHAQSAFFTTADGMSDDFVTSSCTDATGAVWAGTQAGGIHCFVKGRMVTFSPPELAGAAITALLAPAAGELWIGTADGRLFHTGRQLRKLTAVRLSPKLRHKAILALCLGNHRGLWIGTDGGGLGYVEGLTTRGWGLADGLPDDVVAGMVEDNEGNLWLVTSKGLCRVLNASLAVGDMGFRPLKVKLLLETDPAPLRGLKVGGPRALRTGKERLWFATSSGLVGVDVHGWESDAPPPPVEVESILVNHRTLDVAEGGAISVPSNSRSLEFHFTALSFEAPEKVRFRHKLKGFDPDWVEGGSSRSVQYGPLPSGNYEFDVTACNAEGIWNEKGASLAFRVPTPLWRAPWFLGVCALAATAAGAGGVRFVSHRRLRRRLAGLEQQQAMERERMRIAQNMHDEIGSKLTKISYLSERAKVEMRGAGKVEGKIDSIASTSRELLKALDEIVWAVNPRNDSLEHLAAYLCQHAREYFQDTPVECDLHVQSELPPVEMSAELRHNLFLAFEESLNNVLKHAAASRVGIEITSTDDCLTITVEDNGRGFERRPGAPPAAGIGGQGLNNMRQRLSNAGGDCSIISCAGRGTTVRLSIPLSPAKILKS